MSKVVLDSCVVVDMFMVTRPRHEQAKRLRFELARAGITARMPSFALFEISHAIRQESRLSNGMLLDGAESGKENGLSIDLVPIDEAFIHKYLGIPLPELRAGDLTFAASNTYSSNKTIRRSMRGLPRSAHGRRSAT